MKLKIEYSVLSPGTERNSKTLGYMDITEEYKTSRFMVPVSHGVQYIDNLEHGLCCKNFDIANIAISRFQLISTLNFGRLRLKKNAKILICGLGCVGLGAVLELHRLKCQHVDILSQKENASTVLAQINDIFTVIKNADFNKYDYIIDATGSGIFLTDIIAKIKNFGNIVILGTPRLDKNVDALLIHRKNITLYGFHEINGFSDDTRNKVFARILKNNVEISKKLKNIIYYCLYTDKNRKLCLSYKNKLQICIFKKI